jgi:hypothetical protein
MQATKMVPLVLIAMLTLVASSCEQDIHLTIPPNQAKLVVNSGVNPDSTLKVYVGRTVRLFDKTTTKEVDNAAVTVTTDDGSIVLHSQGSGLYTSTVKPLAGKMYAIEVKAEGMATVTSNCTVPPRPTAGDVTISEVESAGKTFTQVEFILNDPAETDDYYIVEMRRATNDSDLPAGKNLLYYDLTTKDIFCENVSKDEYSRQLLFHDTSFNGKMKKIAFSIEGSIAGTAETECIVKRCSNDFWEYKRTLSLYEKNINSPFSQSFQVYTNIANGVGIFGAYSSTVCRKE